MHQPDLFLGFDVGTAEARAALVSVSGEILAEASLPITTWTSKDDEAIYEQSSSEIYSRLCDLSKQLLAETGVLSSRVKGVGIDTTCSMAVCDLEGRPRCVTPGSSHSVGRDVRDVILWRDLRAVEEAREISRSGSEVLRYTGGTMDAELELPRLLWLERHMSPATFAQSATMPLCDALVYRMTNCKTRSTSSLVRLDPLMKALAGRQSVQYCFAPRTISGGTRANLDLLAHIGLDERFEPSSSSSPPIMTAGQPVGSGLTVQAAHDLGLMAGTPVGAGLIDSHAGWLGVVAQGSADSNMGDSASRLTVIAGTSTCFVVQSAMPIEAKGFWGPLLSSAMPGYWMSEGGQPTSGALIDHVIESHPASAELETLAKHRGVSRYACLESILQEHLDRSACTTLLELTRGLHVYPDFHGNRSPLADPSLRGSITGLTLSRSLDSLATLYYATLQSLAFQTRQNVELLNQAGHQITRLVLSGGLVRNQLLMQLLADICDLPILLPANEKSAVMLGAAICGRIAAEDAANVPIQGQDEADARSLAMRERVWTIMTEMTRTGSTLRSSADVKTKRLLNAKYSVFLRSIKFQQEARATMDKAMG